MQVRIGMLPFQEEHLSWVEWVLDRLSLKTSTNQTGIVHSFMGGFFISRIYYYLLQWKDTDKL